MRISKFYLLASLFLFFIVPISFAQVEQEVPLNSLRRLCEHVKNVAQDGQGESKDRLLLLVEEIPKAELEKSLYSALIQSLLAEDFDICSHSELDLIVTSVFPPASQISILNKSVLTALVALDDTESSITKLSDLSDSLGYLLTLSDLPKDKLLSITRDLLNNRIQNEKLDIKYRYYAYLILSSEYFLLDKDCPQFTVPNDLVMSLDLEAGDLSVIKVRSQCRSVAFQEALGILQKVAETGGLIPLRKNLNFFYYLYPSTEDLREINTKVLRSAFSIKEIRPLAFSLINREIISKLSLKEKAHLLVLGQMPFLVYLILIASLSLPITIYFLIFLCLKLRRVDNKTEKVVSSKTKIRSTSHIDEYSNLLESFGLDDRATEADIKRAYRDLAKRYHPDSADRQMQEEFQKVQTNYDKLMTLRKGWFGLSR